MNKRGIMALLFTTVCTTALAATVEDRLVSCAATAGEKERLACFDTLARDVVLPGTPGQAGTASADSTASRDELPAGKFGLEHKDPNLGGDSELKAVVTGIRKSAVGKLLLTLDNGQVWQQKDSKTLLLHEGDAVLIERGALSAFYLSAGGNKRIAVARVK